MNGFAVMSDVAILIRILTRPHAQPGTHIHTHSHTKADRFCWHRTSLCPAKPGEMVIAYCWTKPYDSVSFNIKDVFCGCLVYRRLGGRGKREWKDALIPIDGAHIHACSLQCTAEGRGPEKRHIISYPALMFMVLILCPSKIYSNWGCVWFYVQQLATRVAVCFHGPLNGGIWKPVRCVLGEGDHYCSLVSSIAFKYIFCLAFIYTLRLEVEDDMVD